MRHDPTNEPATPLQPYSKLLAGHFHQHGRYSARRPRGTSDWLLIYTVAGAGRFGLAGPGDAELLTRPGDAVLLAPGTPHDYGLPANAPGKPLGSWELLWAHFLPRPDWPDDLLRSWPAVASGVFHLHLEDKALRRRATRRLAQMHRFSLGSGPCAVALGLNALEEVLLLLDAAHPRSGTTPTDPRVARAADILCQNLVQPPTLPALARSVGLSSSRLAHLFTAALGRPPARYLEEQRLRRASLLLANTGRTVAEIAADVGFANPFYFSLRFKRHMGRNPRAYRQLSLSAAPVNATARQVKE